MEFLRRDSDDGGQKPVQQERSPDDIRGFLELLLPCPEADYYRHAGRDRGEFVGRKGAAFHQSYTKCLEIVGCDSDSIERIAAVFQRGGETLESECEYRMQGFRL